MRLFGIETEYGIIRENTDQFDSVVESMELVRAHLEGEFQQRWDYRGEDPHEDQRGFRVSTLQQDKEEELFSHQDACRTFSFVEMKSDLVLSNGARFYNDHTHPEYSTPECRTLRDLIAQDRAGERIVQRAADCRNRLLQESGLQLYKNNTDFHGHSYGCHDNYLVRRSIPFSDLVQGLVPFLVSRQIIAGAGKVGIEAQEREYTSGTFQLSQRADFMETELSVDTMHNRPILNTRDEPHADAQKYRRLHLILGDANMCEYATALKVGTTRLVLDVIERGQAPPLELEHSVEAIHTLSLDPELKALIKLHNGKTISGMELQQAYLLAAQQTLGGWDEETDWILREWEMTLGLLESGPSALIGKIDWITKKWLLEVFMQEEQLEWTDPWLASLDLEYHNVNPQRGLFLGLEHEGRVERLVTEDEIAAAMEQGPKDTRGGLRGLCIQQFGPMIQSVQWEGIQFKGLPDSQRFDFNDMFDPEVIKELTRSVKGANTPGDLFATLHH